MSLCEEFCSVFKHLLGWDDKNLGFLFKYKVNKFDFINETKIVFLVFEDQQRNIKIVKHHLARISEKERTKHEEKQLSNECPLKRKKKEKDVCFLISKLCN